MQDEHKFKACHVFVNPTNFNLRSSIWRMVTKIFKHFSSYSIHIYQALYRFIVRTPTSSSRSLQITNFIGSTSRIMLSNNQHMLNFIFLSSLQLSNAFRRKSDNIDNIVQMRKKFPNDTDILSCRNQCQL